MKFQDYGLSAGCWSGAVQAEAPPPDLWLVHRGKAVAQAAVGSAGPGLWSVAVDLPGTVIDRGAHGLLLVAGDPDRPGSPVLARLTLVAGSVAGEELLAEVAQLRAELDLVKRELRRLGAGG